MIDENRQHTRLEKPLTIQYCLAGVSPKKWDMSTIKNISVGGVRFTAFNELKLKDKIIQIQIKIPELFPRRLEVEAIVLHANPPENANFVDVRAEFINLTDGNKKDLLIVEKIVNQQN